MIRRDPSPDAPIRLMILFFRLFKVLIRPMSRFKTGKQICKVGVCAQSSATVNGSPFLLRRFGLGWPDSAFLDATAVFADVAAVFAGADDD